MSSRSKPTFVGLDLGSNCGFAALRGCKRLDSGRWKLLPTPARRVHRGERWRNFEAELELINRTYGPDYILAFEMVRRHVGATAAHVYGGWLTKLEEFHYERILRQKSIVLSMPIEVGTWKKASIGKGNAKKHEIRSAMDKHFKFKTKSEDEADALGIALAAQLIFTGKYTP